MDTSSVPQKCCTKCKQEYPATTEYFNRHTCHRDGLASQCRACSSIAKPKAPLSPTKSCTKCGIEYPRTSIYFGVRPTARDGLKSRCRTCTNKSAKPQTPEQHSRYYKRQKETRPDALREVSRRAYWNNAEKIRSLARITSREYQRKHSGDEHFRSVHRAQEARRRARKRGLANDFTVLEWQTALDYFEGCCAICRRPPGLWHTIAQDHWIPLAKGGASTRRNIVPLCHSVKDGEGGCNNLKSARHPSVFLREQFGEKQANQILVRIDAYFATLE